MPVPNLSGALRGWTKPTECLLIAVDISESGRKIELAERVVMDINIQPTPPEDLKTLPSENWSWDWWNVIIKNPKYDLATDECIIVGNARYRIQNRIDWRLSGFSKYACLRDFDFSIDTTDGKIVKYNGEYVTESGRYLTHER